MLDQNTDRMWFVIGAVIVGAAIIFIANGSLPTLFASVSDSFEESASMGTEVAGDIYVDVTGMYENIIDWDVYELYSNMRPNKATGELIENAHANNWYSTLGNIPVEENTSYVFTAPKGLCSPYISYYSSNGEYLGHVYQNGEVVMQVAGRTPAGTAYVKLAAGDSNIDPNREADKTENWIFSKM